VPDSQRRPLWRGRTLALLGILLVAANMRTAVAALSPIYTEIRGDFTLSSVAVGALGMLPPVCFAVFGLIAPFLTRRAGLELVTMVSMAAILIGHIVRASSASFLVLATGSAVTFAGMGVANVLLPPLVKRYFPDRIGVVTSSYVTVLSVFALLPPLVAVPIADSLGWRTSVGMWAAVSFVAILPWLAVMVRRTPVHPDHDVEIEEADPRILRRVWRAPIAWALAGIFAVSALNAYAMFAWLPQILRDNAGVGAAQAGALLSLYAGMGIPAALLVPVLTARMKNVGLLIHLGVACFVVGYLGLIVLPAAGTWVWVALIGFGPLLFPLSLVLINLRTRTHEGAVALSGFVQGLGYVLGALGPLAVGVLHQLTGEWTIAIACLIGTAIAASLAGAVVSRPRLLEDH
jgi:CP family cyanate transporter-like MFS transporter